MAKSFAEALELELKSLDSILDIEGTGGGKVPYHGYVECRLNLPQIEKFDQDVFVELLVNKPSIRMYILMLDTRNVEQTKYVLCTLKNLF